MCAHDINGHGTHCLGTVLGRDMDGVRIGVARGVTDVLVAKVIEDNSNNIGSARWLFDAMLWAYSNGADVINMSLGWDFLEHNRRLQQDYGYPPDVAIGMALQDYDTHTKLIQSLVTYMQASAAFLGRAPIIVAAAGNDSKRQLDPKFELNVRIPAACKGVISVASLQRKLPSESLEVTVSDFSNTGAMMSAPGENIWSARASNHADQTAMPGLVSLNGTSMAAPHVSGAVALWLQAVKEDDSMLPTAAKVTAMLRSNCTSNVFVRGVDMYDRGDGLVQCP